MKCPCRANVKATSQGHGTAGAQHGMCEVTLAFTVLKEPHYMVCICCSDCDVGSGSLSEAQQACSEEMTTCAHTNWHSALNQYVFIASLQHLRLSQWY